MNNACKVRQKEEGWRQQVDRAQGKWDVCDNELTGELSIRVCALTEVPQLSALK